MTKIPVYSEDALDALNDNVKANLDHYRNCDRKWAESFLREKGYESDGTIQLETVYLEYVDDKTKYEVDFRNAKKLHMKLHFKDAAQASSGLIWEFLSLENLDYLTKRWPLPEDDDEAVEVVLNRYSFPWIPGKRKLARGWIASLWRVADLTFDKTRGDHAYELTEEAFRNSDMIQHITDRAPFMNRDVTHALLEYSLKRRKDGNPMIKEEYQAVAVHLNAMAGSARIDCLSKGEIRKAIEDFFSWREIRKNQRRSESL